MKAGEANKPKMSHGFETKGTGDDEISGRMKAMAVENNKENIHINIMLNNDKDNEIAAGGPPIASDVTHIMMDCIMTEL